MSNSGDVQAQPPAPEIEVPAKQLKVAAVEEKKETASKKSKTLVHPPYFQMIKEAITALNEKGGSSPYAIAKYIEQNYQSVLPGNFRKILGLQLKNSVAKGKLIKIKASYKLSAAAKREKGKKTSTKGARTNAGNLKEMKKQQQPKSKGLTKIDDSSKTKVRKPKKSAPVRLKQLKKVKSPVVRKVNKATAAA